MALLTTALGPLYSGDGSNYAVSPLNIARNGIAVPAGELRSYAGNYANAIAAGRKKAFFSKSIQSALTLDSASSTDTWYWAGHMGPLTTTVMVRVVYGPLGSTHVPADGGGTLVITSETGLTGSGSTATSRTLTTNVKGASQADPLNWSVADLKLTVTADTSYRFKITVDNGFCLLGATAYELPRKSLDTSTDTTAVDVTAIAEGQAILDPMPTKFLALLDLIYRRGQSHLFAWTQNAATATTRTTASYANLLDQTVTAYAATSATPTSPGWIYHPYVRGRLDDTTAAVTFYAFAGMASGVGTGDVRFTNSTGTIATINVSGVTPTWYTATATVASATADKFDVLIQGTGAAALNIRAAGALYYRT
jgi:hypothetical protein